jgi:hypothetical protein
MLDIIEDPDFVLDSIRDNSFPPNPYVVENHALRVAVEEQIRECWRIRQWYRVNLWAEWTDLRRENEVALRTLVKVARKARRTARPIIERTDPIDISKAVRR